MNKGRKWLVMSSLLASAMLALSACATGTKETSTPRSAAIIATFYPLQYLAQRIGGDRVEVTSLVPVGVEPHDFEPSPQDMAAIQKGDLFLYNGAGLEPWANRVIAAVDGSSPMMVNASLGVQLLRRPDEELEEGHEEEGLDPHVWLDPRRYGQQARNIRDALVQVDAKDIETYDANLSRLLEEMEALETEFRKGLASCARDTIVTAHSAFAYMAERFGLRQLALAGLSPEVEPSPARMKEIVQEVRGTGATHIFFETLASPSIAQAVARETGAKTMVLNPLEGLTQGQLRADEDYFTIMRQNLANLRTSLACQ